MENQKHSAPESRIDQSIKKTKASLSLNRLYDSFMEKKKRRDYSFHEYGRDFARGPIIAVSLFLIFKLAFLYVIKAVRGLFADKGSKR